MEQKSASGAPPCPLCGRPAQGKALPFCSTRCQQIDLARWLTGSYAVPAVESDEPDDDEV